MIDTHCHLSFDQFDKDRDSVISRSREKLSWVAEIGVGSSTNEKALSLSKENPGFIFPTFGLHPLDVKPGEYEKVKEQVLLHKGEIIAIGEIGLDYHHFKDEKKRDEHKEVFKDLLKLCEETKKPAVIHSREAEQECFDIISSHNLSSTIMHCFSGSISLAKHCIEAGHWISVPTSVVFSKQKQELVSSIGINSILLETDAPFLSPIKGKRNEPVYVEYSAKKIASILNIPLSEVVEKTSENAGKAFQKSI